MNMAERYNRVIKSRTFNTNWQTNIQSSLYSREKIVRAFRIVSNLLSDTDKPILNAGSNIGFHSYLITKGNKRVISLDPSISALRNGVHLGWIVEPVCGDVMHLPFRKDMFSSTI